MKTLKDFTVSQLRNAIWSLNNGMAPSGGFPTWDKDEIRRELLRRGETPYGYHEDGYVDDTPPIEHEPPAYLTVCRGI